ncbi:hypothetical protein IMX07_00045 [bacterium]|nr:hypothetical protein [bacterium]
MPGGAGIARMVPLEKFVRRVRDAPFRGAIFRGAVARRMAGAMTNVEKPRPASFGAIVLLLAVAALWGIGERGLALAGLACGAIIALKRQSRRRRARNAGRADAMIAATRAVLAKIESDRRLPSLTPPNLVLRENEFALLREARSRGFGLRLPRAAPPSMPYLRFAGFSIYDDFGRRVRGCNSAVGELYLTNRRLVFISPRANLEIVLQDILTVDPALDSFGVATAGAETSRRFTAENPLLWGLMINWMSAGPRVSPELPIGSALRLDADGNGTLRNVKVSLTIPE